jgi:hypothetical protein
MFFDIPRSGAAMPQRIQLSRTKGWRKPEGVVVVARPSRWGNPWRIVPVTDHRFPRGEAADVVRGNGDTICRFQRYSDGHRTGAPYWAVRAFRSDLTDTERELAKTELRGKDLACWCPLDQPCHADVLLEVANGA